MLFEQGGSLIERLGAFFKRGAAASLMKGRASSKGVVSIPGGRAASLGGGWLFQRGGGGLLIQGRGGRAFMKGGGAFFKGDGAASLLGNCGKPLGNRVVG